MRAVVVVAAGLLASLADATLHPPILPLIVRNPYLSTWLQNARRALDQMAHVLDRR
jgi:hypothetical protein